MNQEFQPGEIATADGRYEELNVFGSPTGRMTYASRGRNLPTAPRGYTWRPMAKLTPAEVRAKAAHYRRLADTASTATVVLGLLKLADRLEAKASQLERDGDSSKSA